MCVSGVLAPVPLHERGAGMGGGSLPTQRLVPEAEPLPAECCERLTAAQEDSGALGVKISGACQVVYCVDGFL